MKTLKLISVIAIMIFSLSAFSNPKDKSIAKKVDSNNTNSFMQVASQSLKLSDSRISEIVRTSIISSNIRNEKMEGTVYVEYHIDEDGTVVVDQINSNNQKLASSIKTQIESLYMYSQSGADKKYCAKFIFKNL